MKISARFIPVVIAVCLLLQSCGSNNNSSHLPPKTMQQILLDINLAEAYSSMKKDSLHRAGVKNIDSLAVYYKDIFAHYHITEAEFQQSLDWYKSNPDDLDSLYNKNLLVLGRWQAAEYSKTPHKDTVAGKPLNPIANKLAPLMQRRRFGK